MGTRLSGKVRKSIQNEHQFNVERLNLCPDVSSWQQKLEIAQDMGSLSKQGVLGFD